MNGLKSGSLPNERERKLYRAILEQGGRVGFREAVEQDAAGVLRLMELGLVIHHTADPAGARPGRRGGA